MQKVEKLKELLLLKVKRNFKILNVVSDDIYGVDMQLLKDSY